PVYAFRAAPDQGLPDGTAVLVRPDGFVAEVETAATGRGVVPGEATGGQKMMRNRRPGGVGVLF
ncbi:MAG TPA: hypothetical protein VIG75_10710, partial [Citricoccus sp.]